MPLPKKGMPTFYNLRRLHQIFFVLSMLWFILLIVLVWQDYNREWRGYQREFRKLDMEKTRLALKQSLNEETKQKLEALNKKLKEAETRVGAQKALISKLEAQLKGVKAQYYLVDQQWRFAKSRRDTFRYQYEIAKQENAPDLHEKQVRYEKAEARVAELYEKVKELKEEQNKLEEQLKIAQKDKIELEKQLNVATLNLQTMQKKLAQLKPSLVNYIRDLPLIDFMVPYFKIKQIYLNDLYYNFTFRFVERADRCTTCHLGIDNPAFADAPQPFKTHPRLDLMVGGNSPHPLERFGCTICHMGRDRGTSFTTAAHMPRNEAQAEIWKEKYGWKPLERWEEPMLPVQYTQATCLLCHQKEPIIPGADALNRGMTLIRRIGCYGCHKIKGWEFLPKAGPSLRKIAAKTRKAWVFHWLKDPRKFRPNWMPKFFDLSNTSDAASLKRNNLEALAIVTYLFDKSGQDVYPTIPVQGDPTRGETLVKQLGCLGCHTLDPRDWAATPSDSPRKFGPNLAYLGSKVNAEWLFQWLKNPGHYLEQPRMPDLRLSDQEAADITAFLMQSRNELFEQRELPKVDPVLLDELIAEQWRQRLTREEIEKRLTSMTQKEKLVFLGEKAIARYGCFGCHDIPGFENAQPIGTELTTEGDKPIHQLDFGYLHIEHTRWSWFKTKLSDPRIFDKGRQVSPLEKLRMPDPELPEEDVDAIVTVLLGLKNDNIVGLDARPLYDERAEAINAGWKIVLTKNCVGCHQIGYTGGAIRKVFEAMGMPSGTEPPILKYENLPGIGARTRTDWLYRFLKQPYIIRPWLKVRMPTFPFSDEELNRLTHFFAALDNVKYPFEETWFGEPPQAYVTEGKQIFTQLRCLQCHVTGSVDLSTVDTSSLAPNLSLVRERLRPEWITQWLKDPSKIMPGTKMPTYPWKYLGSAPGIPDTVKSDPDLMVLAVRNYLLNFARLEGGASRSSR